MIMMMMSTGDIDEECDMEGYRHLLSNHADIEATINNMQSAIFCMWNLSVKSRKFA